MDYKIKYTDALEGIRELYNSDCDMIRVNRLRRQLKRIFPELQESEDEKIRKELIAIYSVGAKVNAKTGDIPDKDIVAWLEKQGEKEVTCNKEDEENMNNILYVFNQLRDTSFYKEDDTAEKIINWLKSLKDRLCSNNEYDKDMLGAIEYCKKNNRPLEKEHLAWLEKQCEQKFSNIPSRETILAIWELGNDWKELTNGSISTEHGTQLEYIQKHWQESSYYNLEEVSNES